MKGWWWAIVLMVLIVFLDSVSPNLFGFGKKKEKEEGMEEEMGGKEKEKEKEKGVRTKEDELKKEKRKLREESKKTEKNKVVIGKEEDSYHLVITRWNENLTWVKDFFVNENNYINNNNNNNNNNNINNNNINNDHNYNYKIDITIIQKLQDKSKEEEEAIQRKIQEGTLSYQDMILSPSKEKERELEKEEWYKQKKRVKVDFISNTNKIGRECSGYIFYILKNYYSLPTWVEFVHGAPEKSAFLARRYLTQPRGYFQSFAGNIVNRCFESYNHEEGKGNDFFFLDDFQDTLREIGIEPPHCMRNFCCANFVVHKSRIQFLPKWAWEKLLIFTLKKREGPGWRNNCYHLEHFWHMLMGEPSHTYIGFTPHPKSNASRILSDFKDEDEIWKSLYREYLKPPREHLLGKDKKEKEKEKGKEKEKEKGKEKGKEKEKGLTERLASTVADFLARPTSEPKEKKETKKKIISKPTDSHHLVITRWNENLTWVKDYFGRHGHAIDGVTVMQKVNDDLKDSLISRKMEKGSFSYLDLHLSTPLKDPPNFDQFLPAFDSFEVEYLSNTRRIGRECSGYIYYILKHYDNLPTWTEFVHGAPEKSGSLAYRYLTEPRGEFQSFAGGIVNRCFAKYQGEEGKDVGGEIFLQDFEDLLREIGIEPPHCMRNFCCANFVVHKNRIRLLSREKWEKLLLYSITKHDGPGWRNNCYHLEHFWHMLMGEPSHTYISYQEPNPEASASAVLTEERALERRWRTEYEPFLKPKGNYNQNNNKKKNEKKNEKKK